MASNTPWRKPPFLLMRRGLTCKHWTTFCSKRRLQNCPQGRVMINSARTPKSPIFWDFAKGGKGWGSKENWPTSRLTSGDPKTPWHKRPYLCISMFLLQTLHNILICGKRRLQKCPQRRVMPDSARTSKSPIFWDFAEGGPRKTGPRSRPTSGARNTPGANGFICSLVCA